MAAILRESLDNLLLEWRDSFITCLVETEIDLSTRPDGADVSFQSLPNLNRDSQGVSIEQSEMRVFNNRAVTQRRFAGDQKRNGLAGLVKRAMRAQMPLKPHARDDSITAGIHVNRHHHILSHAKRPHLLTKWKKQILGQPPIEKRADVSIDRGDYQTGKLARGRER